MTNDAGRQPGPEPRRGYRFGPFAVDASRRVLSRHGDPVPVTPKAFDVLLFMLRNPGRVLGKDEIMEAIWPDVVVEEGTLARNISTLRAALDEHPSEHRYVLTEFGRGYRFVADIEPLEEPSPTDPGGAPPDTATRARPVRRRPRRLPLTLGLAIVASLAAIVVVGSPEFRSWLSGDDDLASLVILPFDSTSDSGNAGVAAGLAESLATDLASVADLRVVSRLVAARYGGSPLDVQRIGRELGVQALVVGRIERLGDDLVVEAELVRADDARRLWGDRFTSTDRDLVRIERAIVAGIRAELGLEPPPEGVLAGVGTEDPEAYRLYLLGRHEWQRSTEVGVRASLDYYRRAVAIDPEYALAYAGIADAYVALGMAFAHPRESFARAEEAVLRALAIDETLAPAHISMGAVQLFYQWDWEGAERSVARARSLDRSYRDAIEVNTAYGDAFHYYCGYLEAMGRWDEAVAEIRRGLELDPESSLLGAELAWSYYVARRFRESAAQARAILLEDPDAWLAYSVLGAASMALGRNEEAVEILEEAQRRFVGDPVFVGELGLAYAVSGRADAARDALIHLHDLAESRYVDPYFVALIRIGLDEPGPALEALESAREDRSPWLTFLALDWRLDPLREIPRFEQLAASVLPPTDASQ